MSSDEFNENNQEEEKSTTKIHENSSDHADVTNRLTNLSINKTEVLEKKQITNKSLVDDDDLDLDLDLDENIDTSVSPFLIDFENNSCEF